MGVKTKYVAAIVVAFMIIEFALIFMMNTGSQSKFIAKATDSATVNISIIAPTVALSTDQSSYQQNSVVSINGSGYTVGGDTRLNISNSTGHTVTGFPVSIVPNPLGRFTSSWNISGNNTGEYVVRATDYSQSGVYASKTITVTSGVVCADSTCSGSENCVTCPADCGSCPTTEPTPSAPSTPRLASCPSQDRIISLDLDRANSYVETLGACDKAFIIFSKKSYEFHIRRYMSSINSLELEIGKNRFVLPAGNVKELDLDGDGKIDMTVNFLEVAFDVVFEFHKFVPVSSTKIGPVEFAPVIRETLPLHARIETLRQVAAMLLLLLIIVTIGTLTSYWRKILRERR